MITADEVEDGLAKNLEKYREENARLNSIISNYKKAEASLKEDKARIELALKGAGFGLWDQDQETGSYILDKRAAEILGHETGIISESEWDELVYQEDLQHAIDNEIQGIKNSEQSHLYGSEYRILTKSGDTRWISENGSVIEFDKDGIPIRSFGILQDITQRKKAENVVQESARRLDLALRAADLGMWDYNDNTEEYILSNRAIEILGHEIKDDAQWSTIIHPDDLQNVIDNEYEAEEKYEDSDYIFNKEYRIYTKSGEMRWVSDRGRVVEWDENREAIRSIGTLHDITDRKQVEEQLQITLDEKENLIQELKKSEDRLKTLSLRDGLTGLYNRHYLTEFFNTEFKRTQRYEADIACLMLDLDFFKEINDIYGHPFGDFVLKEFAGFLKKNIRVHDIAFRYGGEEFMIILPQTNIKDAQVVAEKIRSQWEAYELSSETGKVALTVSIGLVSKKVHVPRSWGNLVEKADKALNKAKAEGRNRVTVYTDDSIDSLAEEDANTTVIKDRLFDALEKTKAHP